MVNALVATALNLEATFNSISVEATYTDDDNQNSSCLMEVSPAGLNQWAALINYPIPWWDFATADASVVTTGPRAYYGKAHRLNPNTAYDIRVTFSDSDGVTGTNPQIATITTRADNIPDIGTLTPTHYVSPTGSDTNAGTTAGAPWRTLARVYYAALAQTADMVVQFAPGHYTALDAHGLAWATAGSLKLTLKAQNPAISVVNNTYGGEAWKEAVRTNQGSHSIIEARGGDAFPQVFAPTGATDADLQAGATYQEATSVSATATRTLATQRVAPWAQVQVASTNGGADAVPRAVWKATAPSAGINQLEYSTSRDGVYTRVANWASNQDFDSNGKAAGGVITPLDPGTWAQVCSGSTNMPSGFLCMGVVGRTGWTLNGVAGTTNNTDLYLIMPADAPSAHPNDLWWKMAGSVSVPPSAGFRINGSNVRLSGFELTTAGQAGVQIDSLSRFAVVEYCLFRGHYYHIAQVGTRATNAKAFDSVIQYNRIEDSQLTAVSGPNAANDSKLIPWSFIKGPVGHNSSLGTQAKAGLWSEVVAVYGQDGWGRRTVIRWNTIDHSFDAFSSYYPDSVDRYNGYGSDLYGNLIFATGDDVTDLSRWEINVSIYDNRGENNKSGFCSAPMWGGPIYYFDNVLWRLGDHLMPRIKVPDPFATGVSTGAPPAQAVKYSGDYPNPWGRQVYVNNTIWTDMTQWDPVLGWNPAGGGASGYTPIMYLRNNIIRVTTTVLIESDTASATKWDEDYNDWSTGVSVRPAAPHLLRTWLGDWDYFKAGTNAGANYQDKTQKGPHSNTRADLNVVADPELVSPTTGDVRLIATSVLNSAGVALGNITGAGSPVRVGRRPFVSTPAPPTPPPSGDTTPPVLSAIAVTGITSGAATITWTTDEGATRKVNYGPTSAYGTSTTEVMTYVLSHSVALNGLSPSTTYHYQVQSRDVAGNLASSTDLTFTTTPIPTLSAVAASGITANSATITWTTDQPSTTKVSYGPTATYGSNTVETTSYGLSHSATLGGLAAGTTYHYQAQSRDAAGNLGASADLTFTTATNVTSPVISGVQALSVSQTAVSILWATDKPASSQVDYGTTTAYGTTTPEATALVTNHTVGLGGLLPGTLYHFRVRSYDANRNVVVSADGTFTTVTAVPSQGQNARPRTRRYRPMRTHRVATHTTRPRS